MLSKTLNAAVKNIGLTVTPDNAYGIYGGYMLTILENGNKKTAFFNFILDENEDTSLAAFDISDEIKNNLSTYSIIDYDLKDEGLSVTTDQSIPDFLKMIDFCVELLNNYAVKNGSYCSGCGKEFGKKYPKKITRDNKNYLLCESCTLEIIEEQNKQTEKSEVKIPAKTRFLGVIGSIIGGLIGAFLFFAVSKWIMPLIDGWDSFIFRFILSGLGFATAYFSYLGYKIFCKKASLTAYLSVSIISVIFSLIGHYLGTLLEIAEVHSLRLSDLYYSNLLAMPFRSTALEGFPEYSSNFYIYGALTLILAVSGALIFLLGFYEKDKVVKEEIKIETLKIQD